MKRRNAIDVSVITLNYKESSLTKKCIRSILKSRGIKFEIIVIDNSQTEKDKKDLQKLKNKKIKILFPNKNLGCARGYNLGIEQSQGKYIFILNNDTEIRNPQALFLMFQYLEKHKSTAVIQPKIKSLKNPAYFEYAGAAGGFIDILGYPFCRGRLFETVERDDGQYNNSVEISWASTCAFFANKEALIKAGKFDPIYFAYAEEIDTSLKLWNLGYKVVYFPQVEVFHRGETSWKKIRGRKTFLIHRNHLILFFKCFPLKKIFTLLPQRIFLEFVSLIYYIIHNSNLHIFPVMFSHVSLFFLFPQIIKKRTEFFKETSKNKAPVYNRSIVYEYFLNKRKKFTSLDLLVLKKYYEIS